MYGRGWGSHEGVGGRGAIGSNPGLGTVQACGSSPAADWIAEHRALALKPEFDRFIQNRTAISDREREALFREFQQYLQSSSR